MCKSLLVFHCNYGPILYRFRDKATFWPKIAIFFIPPAFDAPLCKGEGSCRNITVLLGIDKLEWYGDLTVKKSLDDTFNRLDRRTSHDSIVRAMHRIVK